MTTVRFGSSSNAVVSGAASRTVGGRVSTVARSVLVSVVVALNFSSFTMAATFFISTLPGMFAVPVYWPGFTSVSRTTACRASHLRGHPVGAGRAGGGDGDLIAKFEQGAAGRGSPR